LLLVACGASAPKDANAPRPQIESVARESGPDTTSYARPADHRTTHISLDLAVDFAARTLSGAVTLELTATSPGQPSQLVLDTRALDIQSVTQSADGVTFAAAAHDVGTHHAVLGAPLTIALAAESRFVKIHYSTHPTASGLQWLDKSQTNDKKAPFLYSQSQAIHARSWIPLQDTPAVRATYTATIRVPKGLLALMSATNPQRAAPEGKYSFKMEQPIPSYLIALAVGDLDFKAVGARTGIYAEASVLPHAHKEFEDMESMVVTTEKLYGPYRWGRFDVLVLPSSFPFGGMENPRLTFATPTILAGDKSLVSLIAHELAHSWSGNLVTNATWRDLWLNEGFTVYVERRIQEALFGPHLAGMEAALGRQELAEALATIPAKRQILHAELNTDDPDILFSGVAYEKGALFLTHLEEQVGREKMDRFLKGYFERFAFQAVTTADFVRSVEQELLPDATQRGPLTAWLYEPGLPKNVPVQNSTALDVVGTHAEKWVAGDAAPRDIPFSEWSTHERLHFLRALPNTLTADQMSVLYKDFGMKSVKNSEIQFQWLLLSIRTKFTPPQRSLERFLVSVGRLKFIRPLYRELIRTPEGQAFAARVFAKARPGYHPIAQEAIERVLAGKDAPPQ